MASFKYTAPEFNSHFEDDGQKIYLLFIYGSKHRTRLMQTEVVYSFC